MKIFTDNFNRTWTVSVNVAGVKRCRALAGTDLLALIDDGFTGLAKLLDDPVTLCDVVFVLCGDEPAKAGVSLDDFGAAVSGAAIERMKTAFYEEYSDFFSDARVRTALQKIMEAYRKVGARMDEQARAIDVESLLAATSNGSSGSTPEPSESTPDLIPTPSSP